MGRPIKITRTLARLRLLRKPFYDFYLDYVEYRKNAGGYPGKCLKRRNVSKV